MLCLINFALMNKLITLILIVLTLSLQSYTMQQNAAVTQDKDGSKMLTGISSDKQLVNDTAFNWFKTGMETYKPDVKAIDKISQQGGRLAFIVFGGTWCSDTHDLLPPFYNVMKQSHISENQITLHLVDRTKRDKDGSTEKYDIQNLPTFIIYKDGKEVGRIVETAKKSIESDIASFLK